jgi:dipeptidyl aminopeptidase/acylaminoacyl peptidase
MHGSAGRSVPPKQSLTLALRLRELDKNYELIVFDGADHILSQRRNERDRHVLDWFERHRTTRD